MSAGQINPEILVIARMIDQISGQAKAIGTAIEEVGTKVKQLAGEMPKLDEPTKATGISLSRLALSLRMISISTAILRRELGMTHPVLDAMSKALLVTSSLATMGIASYSLFSKAIELAGTASLGTTVSLAALQAGLTKVGIALMTTVLGPIVAVGAAIAALGFAAWYWSPHEVAVRDLAGVFETLEDSVKSAQVATENLRYEMMGLSIQDQMLRIQELELQAAIEQRGFATQAELNTIAAVEAAQRRLNVTMAYGNLEQQQAEMGLMKTTMQLEDLRAAVEELPSISALGFYGMTGAGAEMYPALETPQRPWESPYGQGGVPGVRPPRARAAATTSRISVSISFPYARFASEIDVRSAVRAAGEDAAIEFRRRL